MPTRYVPVETSSKVAVGPLATGDPQVTLSHVECLPQALALGQTTCRPSCLTQLELLFTAPVGRAQYPSQSLLQSTAQSSLHASMETTTKPSRRWQPPRVTSTTSLQLEHLVPLDAISQCIALESLTRNGFTLHVSTSELEAYQTKHTQGQHIPKVLNLSQARAPPLFIAPKRNRAVGALEHISARSPASNVRAPDIGWRCPMVKL